MFAKRTSASILNRSKMQITTSIHREVGDVNLTVHIVLKLIENCDRFIYLSPSKHTADRT